MDFINIYKLSNYIKDKTDSLLARYGHVNKLAEDTVISHIGIQDLESGTGTQTFTLNTKRGIIKNINLNLVGQINVYNDQITDKSIIFYNLVPSSGTELTQLKASLAMAKTLDNTAMQFMIYPTVGNSITGDIQFWIINPS